MDGEEGKKNLEPVCMFIETGFFVSHSRGNIEQFFSIDIICEKICSKLDGFWEGGTGSACFQKKKASLCLCHRSLSASAQ